MPHAIMLDRHVSLSKFENPDSFEGFHSSSSNYLQIHMGPYEANGIIRHRLQRLSGLQVSLSKYGYNVELIPTVHLDRFSMQFYDIEIFRCNIKNFQFNIPAEEDPLCRKILLVLKEHEARFFTDENIPKFVNVHHGLHFLQMNKFLTTADRLSTSDVKLIFEINKVVVPLEETISDGPISLNTINRITSGNTSDDVSLTPDEESAEGIIQEEFNKATVEGVQKVQDTQETGKDGRATMEKIYSENQERRKIVVSSENIDDDAVEHRDVLEHAIRLVRIRHASSMFKSKEIRSVDSFKSTYEAYPSIMDEFVKSESKNQKLISKVMLLRKNKLKK